MGRGTGGCGGGIGGAELHLCAKIAFRLELGSGGEEEEEEEEEEDGRTPVAVDCSEPLQRYGQQRDMNQLSVANDI
jgi:hypothetical protein